MSQTEPSRTTPTIRCTVTARVGTDKAALVVKLPDRTGLAWAPGTQVLLTLLDVDQSAAVSRVDLSSLGGGGDPSSGVVGLPDAAIEAAAEAIHRAVQADADSLGAIAEAGLCAALPLIAARVHAEAVADERQRWEQLIRARLAPDGVGGVYQAERNSMLKALLAAGSVPVATPEPPKRAEPPEWFNMITSAGIAGPVATSEPSEPYRACAGCDGPGLCKFCEYRVATPTEPEEPRCPKDRATFEEHYERGLAAGREEAADEINAVAARRVDPVAGTLRMAAELITPGTSVRKLEQQRGSISADAASPVPAEPEER